MDPAKEEIVAMITPIDKARSGKDSATETAANAVDVDEYLEYVGPFGKFQILLLLLFSFIIIPPTYQTLIMSFVGSNPSWKCSQVKTVNTSSIVNMTKKCNLNGSIDNEKTEYSLRCQMKRSEWMFTRPKEYSIVTDWELICEKEYLLYLANSALFIGWAVGAVILGWVSDRFGRKIVLFPSWTILILASFISGFINDINLFIFLRAVIGFCQGGVGLTLFVMASELVGPKYRSLSGTTIWFAFTLALCIMGMKAWLIPKWKILEIVSSIPYIILLASYKYIPESVRWLRVKSKLTEATSILHKVARVNKVIVTANIKLSPPPSNHGKSASFIDLFRPSHMLISTLVQCFAWFSNGQVYYGISLASDQLGGNMYRDFILTSLVEIPANIILIYLTNKIGRKPTVISSFAISGLSCIGVAFIPTVGVYNAIRVTFGMLGKLCITISFNAIYIWSVELFPTVVRSQGMGLLSVVSRIGAASAPWVAQFLRKFHKVLPFTVMGSLALISAFLCLVLRETRGAATSETFNDEGIELRNRNGELNGDGKVEMR